MLDIIQIGSTAEVEFGVEDRLAKFIFLKGYVALNGASLTVAKKTDSGFRVALIPETLSRTNLGKLKLGHKVNLEVDRTTQTIVETVERVLRQKSLEA